MIEDAPASVLTAASVLRTVQEVCVNMVIARPTLVPHHWFYIYDNDVEPSRVAVINNIVSSAAPQDRTVLQAEVFRREDESMPVAELADKAVRDLSRVLGFDPSADVVSVNPVPVRRSYVVSDLRRASAVDVIVPWLREKGIYTMGLFGMWKYVWSDVAFRAGEKTAEDIMAPR
jgi:protoporphyrinogen oxidase